MCQGTWWALGNHTREEWPSKHVIGRPATGAVVEISAELVGAMRRTPGRLP